jgi:hypothetical protein
VVTNRDRCVLCSQTWFPRDCRGSGLYGLQFMPVYNGKRMKNSCCCTMELCRKIGYDHQGMMSLPLRREKCIAALTALAVDPVRRQQIADSPRNFKVAHWHYSPRHRMKDPSSGKWMFRNLYLSTGGSILIGIENGGILRLQTIHCNNILRMRLTVLVGGAGMMILFPNGCRWR